MDEPGINVLAHSSQHEAEEPAVTASSARLEQVKVVLLAFDGALGTRADYDPWSAITRPAIWPSC